MIQIRAKTHSIVPISGCTVAVYGFSLEHETPQGVRNIFLTQPGIKGLDSYQLRGFITNFSEMIPENAILENATQLLIHATILLLH